MKRALVYHGFSVGPTVDVGRRDVADFERDLERVRGEAPVIALDDGLASQYILAAPALKRHDARAIFFIASALIGEPGYMQWNHVRELAASGHQIGSHTRSHVDLSAVSFDAGQAEITAGIEDVERETGIRPVWFSWPYTRRTVRLSLFIAELGLKTSALRIEVGRDTPVRSIASAEYWDSIYRGAVRAEPGRVAGQPGADRYTPAIELIEGPRVLDVGSGNATLPRRLLAAKGWRATALDFSEQAKARAGWEPYIVAPATELPFPDKSFDTVACLQALEYMDQPAAFLAEARRVADRLVVSATDGPHPTCSQAVEYTPETFTGLLGQFGVIETFRQCSPAMLLARLVF